MIEQIEITGALDPVWSVRLIKSSKGETITITFMDDQYAASAMQINFDELKKAIEKLAL